MAILQEADAVFYHPLDNVTESLEMSAWAGPASFDTGKVSDAMRPVSGGAVSSIGAQALFNNGTTNGISTAAISPTKFVVTYSATTDSNRGLARIGTVSGTDITYGATAEFVGATTHTSVVVLSPTTIVIMYTFAGVLASKVGTVSGADITYGAETSNVSVGSATSETTATFLSATTFITTYVDGGLGGNPGVAKIGTLVAGPVVVFGSSATFNSSPPNSRPGTVVLSPTTFVIASAATGFAAFAVVGTVAGVNITFGATNAIGTSGVTGDLAATFLSATSFVVTYIDSNVGLSNVATVSGTDITFGAAAQFTALGDHVAAVAMSQTAFVVVYRDITFALQRGATRVGTVSGTDIAFGEETEFLAEVAGPSADGPRRHSVVALDASKFVFAYEDQNPTLPNEPGMAKVGILPFVASLANPPGPAAFGPDTEFFTSGASDISVARLSATKFVVAYRNTLNNDGVAKIGTVAGTDITFDAGSLFNAAASETSIAALSATKFVVTYQNGAKHGTAQVGTVSGTAITFGAENIYHTTGAGLGAIDNSVAVLSATAFVVAYQDDAADTSKARVGTVSGTDITFGAVASFTDVPVLPLVSSRQISVTTLDATKIVVAYTDPASPRGSAKVGTVSGTDITFGAKADFNAGPTINSTDWVAATTLSATSFVVAYTDISDSSHGTAKVGTVSGTDITFGAGAEFLSAGAATEIAVTALSAIRFAVVYKDGSDSGHGTARIGAISGTSIVFGTDAEFVAIDGGDNLSVTAMSDATFVVAYADITDASHGTTKLGTAQAPTPYATAAGATRLAFSGWTRNPT